jgi:hypothetical protein
MNKLLYVVEFDQVTRYWDFFLEGLEVLNGTGTGKVSEERFFKTLLHVSMGQPDQGALMMILSKNDKPVAFTVLMNNTQLFCPRSALCFALYSRKSATAVPDLHREVKRWCREHRYVKLYAASQRINGCAVRLFGKWGFKQEALVFSKPI